MGNKGGCGKNWGNKGTGPCDFGNKGCGKDFGGKSCGSQDFGGKGSFQDFNSKGAGGCNFNMGDNSKGWGGSKGSNAAWGGKDGSGKDGMYCGKGCNNPCDSQGGGDWAKNNYK